MKAGERWLDRIQSELREAKVIIVLVSLQSVTRPWINFEAGAAWLNGAHVVPACIGDLTVKNLPKPYNDFHAVRLASDDELYQLIRSVSEATGDAISAPPPPPWTRELVALQEALSKATEVRVSSPSVKDEPTISRQAEQLLAEAARSATGQIARYDLDQGLVIKVNGQSLTADLGEGKRRAELEGAIEDLETLGLIEDKDGNRVVFAVTRRGYDRIAP